MNPSTCCIHDVLLHDAKRREGGCIQGVLTGESAVCLFSERQSLGSGAVGQREAFAVSPAHIVYAHCLHGRKNLIDWLAVS
jgi:hypothetical protein